MSDDHKKLEPTIEKIRGAFETMDRCIDEVMGMITDKKVHPLPGKDFMVDTVEVLQAAKDKVWKKIRKIEEMLPKEEI